MLKQNFDADQDEDNAAEYFRFALEQRAEAFAKEGGSQREQQGGQSDDAACREDLHLKQRKADADSKSVDAGRNGLGDNGAERKVDVTFFLLRSRTIDPAYTGYDISASLVAGSIFSILS